MSTTESEMQYYPAGRYLQEFLEEELTFVYHQETQPLSKLPACGTKSELILTYRGLSPEEEERLCPRCLEILAENTGEEQEHEPNENTIT